MGASLPFLLAGNSGGAGGTSVIEVADDAARYDLTASTAPSGSLVVVTGSPKRAYLVIDSTKLTEPAGYIEVSLLNLSPQASSEFRTTGVGATTAALAWGDAADGGSTPTSYILYRRVGGTGAWTQVTTLTAPASSYTATGLTENTAYQFRLVPYNGTRAGKASTVAFTTFTAAALAYVYHVIIAGQSNGTGGNAEIQSISAPSGTVMFNGGLRPSGSAGDLTSFTAVVEDTVAGTLKGMSGQSLTPAIASELSSAIPLGASLLVSVVAKNGEPIANIKKGTTPFSDAIAQATAAKTIANAQAKNYRCLGVVFVHGETDDQYGTATYGASVLQLQADFETDIKAATGQTANIPLFACQQAGFYYNNTPTSANATTVQLYNTAVANPTKICLVSPRYMMAHTDAGVHLDHYAVFWQGGRYGRALKQWLQSGTLPAPISVASVAMANGNTEVLLTFNVPAAPLVWDDSEVLYLPHRGFFFYDDSATPPTVVSAAIEDGTKVRLTLSAASTGGSRRVSYARKIVEASTPINAWGAFGNLRDSAEGTTAYGFPVHNWCPAFNLPV